MLSVITQLAIQARIVGVNASYFLKNGGFFVISIKASCIDSTAPPEAVFAREVKKLQELQLKPKEQVLLSFKFDNNCLPCLFQSCDFSVLCLLDHRMQRMRWSKFDRSVFRELACCQGTFS